MPNKIQHISTHAHTHTHNTTSPCHAALKVRVNNHANESLPCRLRLLRHSTHCTEAYGVVTRLVLQKARHMPVAYTEALCTEGMNMCPASFRSSRLYDAISQPFPGQSAHGAPWAARESIMFPTFRAHFDYSGGQPPAPKALSRTLPSHALSTLSIFDLPALGWLLIAMSSANDTNTWYNSATKPH